MKRLNVNNMESFTLSEKHRDIPHAIFEYDKDSCLDAVHTVMQFNITEDGYLYATSSKPLTRNECINLIEFNNFPNDHVCIPRTDFDKLVKVYEESKSNESSDDKLYERLCRTSFNTVSSMANEHYNHDEPLIAIKQQVVSDSDLKVLLDCIGSSIDRGDIKDFTSNSEEVIKAYNNIKNYLI